LEYFIENGWMVVFLMAIMMPVIIYIILKKKKIDHWIVPYFISVMKNIFSPKEYPQNVYFCFVDHFEPGFVQPRMDLVDLWCEKYPIIANRHMDCRGKKPQHNFFIPIEEYHPDVVEKLSKLCHKGFGEVEIHLHHDNDTSDNTRQLLHNFKKLLFNKYALLRKDELTNKIQYAFIHGNWALDNSRKDGRWCGVNDEISILKETGCYADLTMPSGSGSTQTRTINSIYYAIDDPSKPKSHDSGIPMEIGKKAPEDGLLMIQGPLALNWWKKKFGILPHIEDADVSHNHPPTPARIDLWIKQRIRMVGDNCSVVVKVHTHGAQIKNAGRLLDEYLDMIYSYLEKNYNDGKKYKLYYVTPYELYRILKGIECGKDDQF